MSGRLSDLQVSAHLAHSGYAAGTRTGEVLIVWVSFSRRPKHWW